MSLADNRYLYAAEDDPISDWGAGWANSKALPADCLRCGMRIPQSNLDTHNAFHDRLEGAH